MYKRCNPTQICQTYQHLRWIILFVYLIYYWIFIELCPIIQQKRRRPDATPATTYSQRRTNNTVYRPAKIILCIWRVGNRIFHLTTWKQNFPLKRCEGNCYLLSQRVHSVDYLQICLFHLNSKNAFCKDKGFGKLNWKCGNKYQLENITQMPPALHRRR